MYRLLIVDDEEIITDSLYEVFQSFMPEELDVCRAYSGKEALAWMARTRIDIVLTDIRMPGMSGLDLSAQIVTHWPRCRIIFLTGYSEFEYAYQAIQMANVRYLLKTEGYDKVMETVREVVRELDHDHQMSNLIEQYRDQFVTLQHMEHNDYFRHLLQDDDEDCKQIERLKDEFAKLNIELNPDQPVALVLGHPVYEAGLSYMEKRERLSSIRFVWDLFLADYVSRVCIEDKFGDVLWLLQAKDWAPEHRGNHFIRFLEGTLELIQKSCKLTLHLAIPFAIVGELCEWRDVPQQYANLRQLMLSKIGDGISMIVTDEGARGEAQSLRQVVRLKQKVEQLSMYLDAGRKDDYFALFDQLCSAITQSEVNVHTAVETYYAIALSLLSYINRWSMQEKLEHAKLMQLDDHGSLKVGLQYLSFVANRLFLLAQEEKRSRTSDVMDRVCEYIEEHIDEDLSLVRLAEIHHFNPSYLSRLFKQEKGVNLSEYIDHCRIKQAKELLKDRDLKVREVALGVGYEAAHSFSRFFKKLTGLTPQQYRDLALEDRKEA